MDVTTTNTHEDKNPTETVEALLERLTKKSENKIKERGRSGILDISQRIRDVLTKSKMQRESQRRRAKTMMSRMQMPPA